MEELNILEVPRILADTRYEISDRLKLADQFSDIVIKEFGPLLKDFSRFIKTKEPEKFSSLMGSPDEAVYKMFVQPSHVLAVISPDNDSIKDDVDVLVKEMTKTLESLIKTKSILGV